MYQFKQLDYLCGLCPITLICNNNSAKTSVPYVFLYFNVRITKVSIYCNRWIYPSADHVLLSTCARSLFQVSDNVLCQTCSTCTCLLSRDWQLHSYCPDLDTKLCLEHTLHTLRKSVLLVAMGTFRSTTVDIISSCKRNTNFYDIITKFRTQQIKRSNVVCWIYHLPGTYLSFL